MTKPRLPKTFEQRAGGYIGCAIAIDRDGIECILVAPTEGDCIAVAHSMGMNRVDRALVKRVAVLPQGKLQGAV